MSHNQPAALPPPQLQSLLVHWVLASAGRQMPRKEDFRVRSLAGRREHVAIVSPAARGEIGRYLFHVVGGALTARLGRAMTLKSVRDIRAPLGGPVHALLRTARMNCMPAFAWAEVPRGDGTKVTWCDLVLPLYDSDMPGGRLIFASHVVEEEERAADFTLSPFEGEREKKSVTNATPPRRRASGVRNTCRIPAARWCGCAPHPGRRRGAGYAGSHTSARGRDRWSRRRRPRPGSRRR
jgi:hypothetical protein